MGYYYEIYGNIEFSDKRTYNICKLLHKDNQYPFEEEVEGFEFDDVSQSIRIGINIKNNDDYIQKVFQFIYELDNKAEGNARAIGEDSEDKFEIDITLKGIEVFIAELIWKKQKGYFQNKDVKRNANIILKDKDLDKKLIAMSLE